MAMASPFRFTKMVPPDSSLPTEIKTGSCETLVRTSMEAVASSKMKR